MVNKCCVPGRTGNYATGEKVCHKHFLDSDILTSTSVVDWKTGKTITVSLDIPRLRTGAVPSLLPNCPTYLSSSQSTSREPPFEKKSRIEAKALQQEIFKVLLHLQNKKFSFSDLNELKLKLEYVTLQNDWRVISKPNCVVFFYLNLNNESHNILYVIINNELGVNVFIKGIEIKVKGIPKSVSNVVQLDEIIILSGNFLKGEDQNVLVVETISNLLDLLKIEENKSKPIEFLKAQIQLCIQSKGHHKFNSEIMVICSMILFISP